MIPEEERRRERGRETERKWGEREREAMPRDASDDSDGRVSGLVV